MRSTALSFAFMLALAPMGAGMACHAAAHGARAPVLAAGDVRADSAVLWAQADRAGTMLLELRAWPPGVGAPLYTERRVEAAGDFIAKVQVSGLRPGTLYRWRAAWTGDGRAIGPWSAGRFRTAPPENDPAPVHFAWGGDLAGQNVCRDAERGFEIFDAINAAAPELFIGIGDMIYADGLCEAEGRYGNAQIPGGFGKSADKAAFRSHWRYSREDPGLRRLLANTAYLAVWDDHEVVNDFGPLHDTRDEPPYRPGEHLLPVGLAAMLEQNPIAEHARAPGRLYRSVRRGKHLELLLLDTRQYRDANLAPDTAERPKTLLGRQQLTWLKHRLARSDATWVVVASSVPLSIPTGWPPEGGRDGWANGDADAGFERELRDILAHAAANRRDNLLFISGDVHFAAAFRYRPAAERPDFIVHEIVTGPLSAGIGANDEYDRDLGTAPLFAHRPADRADVTDYSSARTWLTFGDIRIDAAGVLTAAIRGIEGQALFTLELTPSQQEDTACDDARRGLYTSSCPSD